LSKDDNVIMTMSGGKRYNETTNGSYNMKIKQITSNHQQLSKDDNVIVTMSGGKHYNETTNGSYNRINKQRTSKNQFKVLARTHKFGVRIPKGIYEVRVLNTANGDTIWQFAICKE